MAHAEAGGLRAEERRTGIGEQVVPAACREVIRLKRLLQRDGRTAQEAMPRRPDKLQHARITQELCAGGGGTRISAAGLSWTHASHSSPK
jgi:hypothetical protein